MQIGFKNLRSLENTGLIDIKPITVLLGQNSSGKSTFLRAFPLLKQSTEVRTTGPLLWYGRFVDFGQFSNAVNDKSKDKFIEFSFGMDNSNLKIKPSYNPLINCLNQHIFSFKNTLLNLQVRGKGDDENNITYCSKIIVSFLEFTCEININLNGEISSFVVDGVPLLIGKTHSMNLMHNFFPRILIEEKNSLFSFESGKLLIRRVENKINEINNKELAQSTIRKMLEGLDFSSSESLLNSIIQQKITKGFSSKTKNWTLETKDFIDLKTLLLAGIGLTLIDLGDNFIEKVTRNVSYVAPLRATAERYYRPQDLSIDEVDFQGKNLALVLNNLSPIVRAEFQKWCTSTFGFYPRTKYSGGNITINVKFEGDGSEHNIADLGFGFSQILPIITQIWLGSMKPRSRKSDLEIKVYAIEQPELHLHPKIQARLINAIINVINYCKKTDLKVYFILETHSETIINAIGTRIYKGLVDKDDVNVVLFERDMKNSLSTVKSVEYDKDGMLKNWPFGFFEEDSQFSC